MAEATTRTPQMQCTGRFLGGEWQMTPAGYGLAALSGGVTSGLGYALWYRVLPQLALAVAAIVQLERLAFFWIRAFILS